jgi:hypothetical protein
VVQTLAAVHSRNHPRRGRQGEAGHVQTVASGTPDHSGVPDISDGARHLASATEIQAHDVTADLIRQLAERARASRFRRYRDRVKGLPATPFIPQKAAGPHDTPLTPVVRAGILLPAFS